MKPIKMVAFDKIDGSNIRVEWSDKQGFYKFGSRTRLIDESTPILGEAITLIQENFADVLAAKFKHKKWRRVVAFFEFHGKNSFAGSHEIEEHNVTLIDVNIYKRGMYEPDYFVGEFGELEIPKVLYWGVLTEHLVTSVRTGTLDDMTFEGIVCKYLNKKKNTVEMFKIKNRAWLDKLKNTCGNDEALYRRLK